MLSGLIILIKMYIDFVSNTVRFKPQRLLHDPNKLIFIKFVRCMIQERLSIIVIRGLSPNHIIDRVISRDKSLHWISHKSETTIRMDSLVVLLWSIDPKLKEIDLEFAVNST